MHFDFLNSRLLRANDLEWVNRHKGIEAVMWMAQDYAMWIKIQALQPQTLQLW
jgi:hypothetical protein